MPKILIVEDNEDNQVLALKFLELRGYETLLATNGEEAIKMAQKENPGLILMDLSLPVMNGWDAANALKNNSETKDIPIIALTAHAMSDDEQKALDAGCDDYETKPIDFEKLFSKIDHWIQKKTA